MTQDTTNKLLTSIIANAQHAFGISGAESAGYGLSAPHKENIKRIINEILEDSSNDIVTYSIAALRSVLPKCKNPCQHDVLRRCIYTLESKDISIIDNIMSQSEFIAGYQQLKDQGRIT